MSSTKTPPPPPPPDPNPKKKKEKKKKVEQKKSSPEASSKSLSSEYEKRKTFGLPIRLQIVMLLLVFIGLVAFFSFQSTIDFLQRDKTAAVKEFQTMQSRQSAQEIGEKIRNLRSNLREHALRLIDPSRGDLDLNPEDWARIRVDNKQWVSPVITFEEKEQYPESQVGISPSKEPGYLWVTDVIKFLKNGKTQLLFTQALVRKAPIIDGVENVLRGPVRALLFDANQVKNGADIGDSLWYGNKVSVSEFKNIFSDLNSDWREEIFRPSSALSRDYRFKNSDLILTWSTVPVSIGDLQLTLMSFVDKEALLYSFQFFVAKQAFQILLLVGFAILIALVVARRMSKPLEKLVGATRQMETGDFDVRVDIRGARELQEVGEAFNHMGHSLHRRETELKQAQMALVQSEKMAALGTLGAGIAHEVKNPLAGILGNTDLISSRLQNVELDSKEKVLGYLEIIRKETKRCREIIDGLMRFSRQDDSKADMEDTDLEIVAWDAVQLNEHSLNMMGIQVKKQFADQLHLIHGNSNQVQQVLLNCLQNAGHAMEDKDGGEIVIGTELFDSVEEAKPGSFVALEQPELKGSICRIFIKDSGCGMTPEVMKKIFEPFFTTKETGKGTGLGLAVTMGILGDHGARVSLESVVGEGTTFLLDFPAKKERGEKALAQLKEIRRKVEGGSTLSTDVGSEMSPPPPVKIKVESIGQRKSSPDEKIQVDETVEERLPDAVGDIDALPSMPSPRVDHSRKQEGAEMLKLRSLSDRGRSDSDLHSKEGFAPRPGISKRFQVRRPKVKGAKE